MCHFSLSRAMITKLFLFLSLSSSTAQNIPASRTHSVCCFIVFMVEKRLVCRRCLALLCAGGRALAPLGSGLLCLLCFSCATNSADFYSKVWEMSLINRRVVSFLQTIASALLCFPVSAYRSKAFICHLLFVARLKVIEPFKQLGNLFLMATEELPSLLKLGF